jgi:hypothetical protein
MRPDYSSANSYHDTEWRKLNVMLLGYETRQECPLSFLFNIILKQNEQARERAFKLEKRKSNSHCLLMT